jgi:hypothetical protein
VPNIRINPIAAKMKLSRSHYIANLRFLSFTSKCIGHNLMAEANSKKWFATLLGF